MERRISQILDNYISGVYFPEIHITDIVEVLILAFLIYRVIIWIKNTKAWMLMKGILVLAGFILLATLFQMHTILYVAKNAISVMAIVVVVVFQPELRRALEKLGEKKFLSSVVPFESYREREKFSEETMEGIIDACFSMGRVKTKGYKRTR